MVKNSFGNFVLAGIVSYGNSCDDDASTPGIFTKHFCPRCSKKLGFL